MKKHTGTIARCFSVRIFRLVASIVVCMMVGTGLASLWFSKTPRQPAPALQGVDIAAITAQAHFDRPARLLNDKDRALYARIFMLQQSGQWQDTDPLIANLDDPLLVGHVLYQRYVVNPTYKTNFAELNSWLHDFGDQPNADKVYRLAMRRRLNDDDQVAQPKLIALTKNLLSNKPSISRLVNGNFHPDVKSLPIKQAKLQTKNANIIAGQVKAALNHEQPAQALTLLNAQEKNLSEAQRGVLLAQIAMGFYQSGKFSHARQIAQRATRMHGQHNPIANWICGLAAWQLHDYAAAQNYFAKIADAHDFNTVDPWFYSAGAFWAARAAGRQGDQAARTLYLQKAGLYPTTFYGVLAHGALGRDFQPAAQRTETSTRELDNNAIQLLAAQPAGERVLALLDIGQTDLASFELQQWLATTAGNTNQPIHDAVSALAHAYHLTDIQRTLRQSQEQNPYLQAVYRNDTLFPLLQDAMSNNHNVDPALIHALIRQESRFDPKAQNKSTGACGLMQLMPETAKFIGDEKVFDDKALLDPKTNLRLGQRYVDYLLRQPYVNGNLMYLAVAYNAGPGNLQNWQDTIKTKNDPLLFIESLPFGQTRAFVEHVMANYWMYRLRMGQGAPDVQALIDGAWPQHNNPELQLTTPAKFTKPAKDKPVEDAELRNLFTLASAN